MGLCFSNWIEAYWLKKPGCQAFFITISNAEMSSYRGLSDLLELHLTSQPCDTHQSFVRSQNSWCRESQELQESCYYQCPGGLATERWCQRGTMGPLRIPNSISPWWFTWQTVACLLYSWILTHTMPWRHLLIEIAPAQFIKGDQTDHMSHKLSEKLHKLGPCQKLLITKSDLTQMTT